jgi:AraC-like DNA-binding protein/uncharacterized membrane protein YhaH (DUF805 family)
MPFDIIFFTLLLFCTYVAFAQWRLTSDVPLIYYMGYLLFSLAHYGRHFWIMGATKMQYFPPPNPPLQWDMPLSYAAFACYFLFLDYMMDARNKAPNLSKVLCGIAYFLVFGIGLNLCVQRFADIRAAERWHQVFQILLLPAMFALVWFLRPLATLFYQKLILGGVVALVLGFFCVLATRHLEGRYDPVENVVCCFPLRNSLTLCLYHLKVGIAIDVACFSWALTLRQKALLATTVITKTVVVPPLSHTSEDSFLRDVDGHLAQCFNDENFTVAALAAAQRLHPDVLTRKMKEKTGLTTEQYILRYRLERALEMLGSTRLNISEIAFAAGFREAAHFSRAFKRHYGQTPGDMRRSMYPKND